MKRVDGLMQKITDPDNLRLAVWKAAKGKRYSRQVLAYAAQLDSNLVLLRKSLLGGSVEFGDYHFFKVYEPKERQICASSCREQVLHHALMNVCHNHFERFQIFDSYASRKGKGTYAALNRAKQFTRRYAWFLKLDVRKFFESVHHQVLKNQLARLFKERGLLEIFSRLIDSYEALPERGLPIGNLTSQYFANHYLAGLDHLIKEKLRVKAYVRYMDDMVFWDDDKERLLFVRSSIHEYIAGTLNCDLKPIMLNRTAQGLPFLGYHIFPRHIRLLQKSKQRFFQKMRFVDEKYHAGEWSGDTCRNHALPLIAFTRHADAKKLRENLLLRLRTCSGFFAGG